MNELKPIKSSLIAAYSYDPNSYILNVVFKSGVEKAYKEIKPDVMAKVFQSGGSVGSKFHRFIRSQYKPIEAG